jgi:hypothetical protein
LCERREVNGGGGKKCIPAKNNILVQVRKNIVKPLWVSLFIRKKEMGK